MTPEERIALKAHQVELRERMLAGDPAARWELVETVMPRMLQATVTRFRLDRHTKEDAESSLRLTLHHVAGKWDPEIASWPHYASMWCRKVIQDRARNGLVRRTSRSGPIPEGGGVWYESCSVDKEGEIFGSCGPAQEHRVDATSLVERADLTSKEITALRGRYCGDLHPQEIGAAEGVSRQAIDQRVRTAMAKLRAVAEVARYV